MNSLIQDVRAFHSAFGHPVAEAPVMMSPERVKARAAWMDEEVQEFRDAKTLVDQIDAMIDTAYFCIGTLVELGVDPQPFWDIVQKANMAKLGPDGRPIIRASDGKTMKPEGWEPPEPKLEAELARQVAAAAAPTL